VVPDVVFPEINQVIVATGLDTEKRVADGLAVGENSHHIYRSTEEYGFIHPGSRRVSGSLVASIKVSASWISTLFPPFRIQKLDLPKKTPSFRGIAAMDHQPPPLAATRQTAGLRHDTGGSRYRRQLPKKPFSLVVTCCVHTMIQRDAVRLEADHGLKPCSGSRN